MKDKLKTQDVWVVTDDTNETYEGIITGLEKQSLYCFTREELEAFSRKCIIEYANYHIAGGTLKTFIDNLFNEKT